MNSVVRRLSFAAAMVFALLLPVHAVAADNEPPDLGIYTPSGFQTKNQSPTISFGAIDGPPEGRDYGYGIDRYEMSIDDVLTSTLPGSATEYAPPSPLPDGDHTIAIEAFDFAGNSAYGAVHFTIDTTPTPTVGFNLSRDPILTGEDVEAWAYGSDSDYDGQIVKYEWDFDGDGTFELDAGLEQTVYHTYDNRGLYTVSVRATNDSGGTATTTTVADVRPAPPEGEVGVSINDGDIATNGPNVTLSLVWPAYADTVVISNDGGFGPRGSTTTLPVARNIPWKLASSGPERLPKTVYVRFKNGGSDDAPYTDDIILDERVPAVDEASLANPKTAAKGYAVALDATDDNSGVAVAEFYAKRRGKPIESLRFSPRTRKGERKLDRVVNVQSRKAPKFVAVLDAAGNDSRLERIRNKHRNL